MKAEINAKAPEFTPFVLTIKVESIEDLKTLWHRFNVCFEDCLYSCSIKNVTRFQVSNTDDIWKMLDRAMKSRGYKI